jgi:hypothetical protein
MGETSAGQLHIGAARRPSLLKSVDVDEAAVPHCAEHTPTVSPRSTAVDEMAAEDLIGRGGADEGKEIGDRSVVDAGSGHRDRPWG